ncbi:MAG: hypothetical protein ACYSWZ_21635 [Planctomycetota bacterium]
MAGESYLKTTLAIALLMVELAFTGTAHPKTITAHHGQMPITTSRTH